MSLGDVLLKALMNRAPRVRGLTKKYFFAEPFLDAWFVWVPLNYMKYGGAEAGEIFNVAYRIKQSDPMSWGKEWTPEVEGAESHCQLNNFGIQQQISYDFLDEVFGMQVPES